MYQNDEPTWQSEFKKQTKIGQCVRNFIFYIIFFYSFSTLDTKFVVLLKYDIRIKCRSKNVLDFLFNFSITVEKLKRGWNASSLR